MTTNGKEYGVSQLAELPCGKCHTVSAMVDGDLREDQTRTNIVNDAVLQPCDNYRRHYAHDRGAELIVCRCRYHQNMEVHACNQTNMLWPKSTPPLIPPSPKITNRSFPHLTFVLLLLCFCQPCLVNCDIFSSTAHIQSLMHLYVQV